MKKLLTLTLTVLMALTAIFGLTACNKDDAGQKVANIRPNTITVGYTDYAPMNFKDDKGTLVGFDTELALMVFNALGYEVKFKLIDWSNKYLELDGGTIDCIWNGFTYNVADSDGVQRSDKVDFTVAYMQNAQCIVRKASASNITSWADFEGKSVAYETGSAADSLVESNITVNANKKGKSSQMDAIREVNSGVTDFAIVDILLAQSLVGQNDYKNIALNEGIEIAAEYYAVGFKKGSELTQKVNFMFTVFHELGMTQKLAEEYNLATSYCFNG